MSATAIAEWVLAIVLLVAIGVVWVRSAIAGGHRGRLRLMAWRRAPRARRAAMEAALEDAAFAPERIEAAVLTILRNALRGEADLAGRTRVDILGVTNRMRDSEDRVVVRVRAGVTHRTPRPGVPAATHIDERWTLTHRDREWHLAAGSGDPLAGALLSAPLIATPEDDAERLHEASLEELTPRAPAGRRSAELVDADAPAHRQLQDLSVADERFDPLLIEAAVTHIVEAWEASSEGSDAPLLAVATGAGVHALNFPVSGKGRRRVRDARLERWEVTGLDAAASPPRIVLRVGVKADAWTDGEPAAGGERRRRRLDLVWTLELEEATHGHPRWRLIDSGGP